MLKSLLVLLLFTISGSAEKALAQIHSLDLKPEQISFDYLSSDGGFWMDCITTKNKQPHSFTASCGDYSFDLHLMLIQYLRAQETTYEFHYWATETKIDKQTHTQSTWLTVDSAAKIKNIIGYLGFKEDATQLRIRIKL